MNRATPETVLTMSKLVRIEHLSPDDDMYDYLSVQSSCNGYNTSRAVYFKPSFVICKGISDLTRSNCLSHSLRHLYNERSWGRMWKLKINDSHESSSYPLWVWRTANMRCSEGFRAISCSMNISWEIKMPCLLIFRFLCPDIAYITMKMTTKTLRQSSVIQLFKVCKQSLTILALWFACMCYLTGLVVAIRKINKTTKIPTVAGCLVRDP